MKGHVFFKGGYQINNGNILMTFKYLFLHRYTYWANFNQTWHKASLDKGKSILIRSNKGQCLFQMGFNKEKSKVNIDFFKRTTGPISTKCCIMHPRSGKGDTSLFKWSRHVLFKWEIICEISIVH